MRLRIFFFFLDFFFEAKNILNILKEVTDAFPIQLMKFLYKTFFWVYIWYNTA